MAINIIKPVFIDDVYVRGMIFAVTIRSPAARGKLIGIKAPKFGDLYTLITAADIPGKNRLDDFPVPILAGKNVSYIGEPVAILAGPDESKLEEYARNCVVTIEEETPYFSISGFQDTDADSGNDSAYNEAQVIRGRTYSTGDTESVFAAASSVIEGEYSTGIQEHWYSAPHGALAYFSDGILTIHAASQWLYHIKRSAAGALNIDDSFICIEQTRMDTHLDGKIWYPSLISCQAALAALVTQKPVKLMLTREEDFRYSPKRNSSKIKIRSALGEKGEVLATEVSLGLDLGAEEVFADEIIDQSSMGSLGIYDLGKVKLNAKAIRTNIPPQGPFAGFGLSQGAFALERHVSQIAEFLKEDPAEWRKRSIQKKTGMLPIGIPLKESVPINELIDTAAAMGDYYRKWASYELLRRNRHASPRKKSTDSLRGIGIAAAYQGAGFLYTGNAGGSLQVSTARKASSAGAYGVEMTLKKDGSLDITAAIPNMGRDTAAIWKTMAHEILEVESGHVNIISGSRDSGPYSLSRNIAVLTRLVEKCCVTIRKQRFRDPLPITVRRTVKPEKINPWNAGESAADPCAFARPGWGAAAVEVFIDPVSLLPGVRGIWLAVDGGKILSEERARRTLKTGVINALGWAGREQLDYEEGMIQRHMVNNYEIPTPGEIPPVYINFINSASGIPKGIGDLPYSCVPAAYAQALSQAIDHSFTKIPVNAQDIWETNFFKNDETETEEEAGEEKAI